MIRPTAGIASLLVVSLFLPSAGYLLAAEKSPASVRHKGMRTKMDLKPAPNKLRVKGRKIVMACDLDGDFSYDGAIDNNDPADNGLVQIEPPGLVLGVGEITKLVVRLTDPEQHPFITGVTFRIHVDNVNRANQSGLFSSFEERQEKSGQVRVWSGPDPDEDIMILDSTDPDIDKRSFTVDFEPGADFALMILERGVYLEGVKPSGDYLGDVRVYVSAVYHLDLEKHKETASVDHILVTVQEEPHEKQFVEGDSEIWRIRPEVEEELPVEPTVVLPLRDVPVDENASPSVEEETPLVPKTTAPAEPPPMPDSLPGAVPAGDGGEAAE